MIGLIGLFIAGIDVSLCVYIYISLSLSVMILMLLRAGFVSIISRQRFQPPLFCALCPLCFFPPSVQTNAYPPEPKTVADIYTGSIHGSAEVTVSLRFNTYKTQHGEPPEFIIELLVGN